MELLPCPFCGGEALPTAHLTYNWFAPVCGRCNARGPSVKIERDSDPQEMRNLMNQADENWNRRASPASVPEGWKPLTDVQWMNIVNLNHAWRNVDKEDAINEVVKLVEAKCKANNEDRLEQEITTLREQVEKLTKERNEWMLDACPKLAAQVTVANEKLAALAEQDETDDDLEEVRRDAEKILEHVMNLPNLTTPALNKIKGNK